MPMPEINISNVSLFRQPCVLTGLLLLFVFNLTSSFAQSPTPSKPKLVVQLGHTNSVRSVAFSPNGRWLASASASRVVKLWEAATGREVRNLIGHTVAFSPDGRWFASAQVGGMVRLWDASTWQEVRTLTGHPEGVNAIAFSPSGRQLASASRDKTLKLWEVATGRDLRTLTGHSRPLRRVAFSPDGNWLASGSEDKTVKLWDAATGKAVRTLTDHTSSVLGVAFSPDGNWLASGSGDKTVKLWEAATGKAVRTLTGHTRSVYAVAFSPDGNWLASGGDTLKLWQVTTGQERLSLASRDRTGVVLDIAFSPNGQWLASGYWASKVKLWDVTTGREGATLGGLTSSVANVTVSHDGHRIAWGSNDKTVKLWDVSTGRDARALAGHTHRVENVAFSPDGRWLASASVDKTVKLWEVATGKAVRTLTGFTSPVSAIAFSPDGRWLATGSGHWVISATGDNTVKLWEVATGRNVRTFTGHTHFVNGVAFSPDGRWLASGSWDKTVKLWDLDSGREVRTLAGHARRIRSVVFSPDSRWLASGSWDKTVKLWDLDSGREVYTLPTRSPRGTSTVAFSPDSRWLATGTDGTTVTLWDVATGRAVRTLSGPTHFVGSVAFSPNGKWLVSGGGDHSVRIWDVATGEELCRLISFRDGSWAVVDRAGRFDASNGGDIIGLHWIIEREAIALNQLKERYYDPGMLAKKLGFNPEPLRDVKVFTTPKLYPMIEVESLDPNDPTLRIKLTNRGGGIGRVVVAINGKELTADARGSNPDPDAATLHLNVPLATHPSLIPGEDNVIEVYAFNAEGFLSSRGAQVVYQPPGKAPLQVPKLWAIVAGVSDYAGDHIDLHYAAKAARDFATALQLGAKRLFGADQVRLTLLTTNAQHASQLPTKAGFVQAFRGMQDAKPWDILVVYLAGHGVAVGDTYYYLTSEARSTELSDPAIRERYAISSDEMVQWLKQSPALKQLMVLDTCAAGTAAQDLVEKRDITSNQIRAIERLKDRTGFHVLMGSAADAVSYEATQYAQGLLTYALLQGMRGAALREEEFVDVSSLFHYAADTVPVLANTIGGIQRPQIAAPRGDSFDIGQLTVADRHAIPLALAKPMLLHPVLLNVQLLYDNLQLTVKMRQQLRDTSYTALRGEGMPVVYVNADQLAGAILPSGTYSVEGERVKANLVLVRNGDKLRHFLVEGTTGDLEGFTQRMVEAILQAILDTE